MTPDVLAHLIVIAAGGGAALGAVLLLGAAGTPTFRAASLRPPRSGVGR